MAILSEAYGVVTDVIQIFKTPEPSPEEQKAKAGVWYKMLNDFVTNDPSPLELSSRWKDQLPFRQKATKQRFIDQNIIGKTDDQIISILVDKINDELIKGGFEAQSQDAILTGMGSGSKTVSSPAGLSTVNAGVTLPKLDSGLEDPEVKESQVYFYVIGSILLVAGVITYLFWNPKKRR